MDICSATVDAFALLARGDAALWVIVWTSLKVAVAGLLLAAPPALLMAYAVAMHRFPGRRVLVVLAQASLSFPTVLIGLVLYLLLSRQGPLGGFGLLFTQGGMILGQAVLGLPVIVAFALATFERADPRLAETARVLGAGPVRRLLTVFRELRFGLGAAVVAGFGRVIAEVGSALMVGGNIEGITRTMTTAIALETSKGEFAQGIALGIVLIALALLVNLVLAWLQGAGTFRRHTA
ncbi:ABC transporter permease [Ralstonia solanacearum]|uniref:Transmembrane protein n=1 Tax=Ralstonia solanacearum (strain Po82) TaxID=1031711 RepID=F6FYU0_RALS8|nr:ABC transporter permease [Ralstonia solanacearum]AEG68173.1 transmembrane protein [Ralstonia solanacearum Po82]AMP69471.1 ABC transporter permease [Ralstonia solanacearum]AMP73616.1 ABC transporter permease [Ralstonia solanacearum]AYB59852.1 ABC transporter permease [Ralstonia solanacearum]MBB6586643.1 ABC transporter permease [Ralstonia solanacearum]